MSSQPGAGTSYPGNLSLPAEVREKIISTFRHTLDLFQDGKLEDCLIGCDFILKMDPRFTPARRLQEKARNPKAEVDVSELQAVVGPPASAAPPRRETGAVAPPPSAETRPAPPPTPAPSFPEPPPVEPPALEGLEDLSLDSLSLDGPLADLPSPGSPAEAGLPFAPSAGADSGAASPFAGLASGPIAADPELAAPQVRSSEEEIAALLRQGDEANAAGDKQQAIEIWSRIFLIDINNSDAVSRIDMTRREMAEESRRVAAALEEGQESFARGDLERAKTQFDLVMPRQTDEFPSAAPAPPPPPAAPLPAHDLSTIAGPSDVLAEEMEQSGPPHRRSWTSIPRPARETAPDVAAAAAPRFGIRLNRRVVVIAAASVVLVVAGIVLVSRLSGGKTEVVRSESGPSLQHATALFREGKIAETTEELRRIPPGHPDYARAQKLLVSLGGAKEPPATGPGGSAPPAPADAAASGPDPAALREQAEKALADKRYIDAMKNFSLAAPHFPGDPTFAQEMAAASEKVSELIPAVKLYNDGDYETAIPILWRIYQSSRDNQDARSYLLRSYFNQGIAQLQNGLYEKAKDSFGEVLSLDPQDVEAARHRQFAERYRAGDLDLLGRIYVRYVSPRP